MSNNIHGILFDLDGTLVDRTEVLLERLIPLLYAEQPALRADHSLKEVTRLIMQADADGYGPPYYGYVCEQWPGIGKSREEMADWHYANFPRLFHPDPRVKSLIASLDGVGVPWGIVTNGGLAQRGKIKHSELPVPEGRLFVSMEVGVEKPSPEIFRMALDSIGVAAPEALFVGDNPVADIDGARRVGMQTAWVRRGREWPSELPPPDHVIDHVAELAPLLILSKA